MNLLHNPRLLRMLTRWIICGVLTEERICALTFDDGPSRRHTPRLLDILARHDCRATFFVLGKHARRLPELVRRAAAAGHEIGNHSFHHPLLSLCPGWMVRREIARTGKLIQEITGTRAELFRPPSGWFSQRVLRIVGELGYKTVLGDVYPRDPRHPGTPHIVAEISGRLRPGSIVILHDASSWGDFDRRQTLDAVELLLPQLRERGFSFLTVSELIERGSVLRPETLDLRAQEGVVNAGAAEGNPRRS